MQRSNTPDVDAYESQNHYPTPTGAKVHGAVEFCEKMGLLHYKEDGFCVSQRYINEKVDEMPDRLRAVIDGDGKMTGY